MQLAEPDSVFAFEEAQGLPNPDGYPDAGMVHALEVSLQEQGMKRLMSETP